ncbi:uncharacterized protein GGS22DRAFT_193747 [Annulohypoxylon maeteangense]|uniref:uncharacterized protein n=1 Tax=Annulohypoxylon maeteangense TaxID=1927788 RepID=UPI0020087643|nr:uncharacterized protein GGS22DRAFT_193747 [Annulohypoxylon maeteangense]KAI0879971.1 hypothetical protein GGS22DRAFT_193747 [Annulohypoxylon maeteangense]
MNTITPKRRIDLLVRQGIDNLREKTAIPDQERAITGPTPSRFCLSTRFKIRSGDFSCFQNDISEKSSITETRSRLLELPNELLYMIASYLNLGDMERLRRTCQHFRALLNPDFLRAHFGGDELFSRELTSYCRFCLERPGRDRLILQPHSQSQHLSAHDRPLGSKCFRCAVLAHDLHVDTRVALADGQEAWICRWCRWPIHVSEAVTPCLSKDKYHAACLARYNCVEWWFTWLGCAQFAVGVVAAALSLVYFRGDMLVFAPVVAGFALMWVCMGVLAFGGSRVRAYHCVGVLELVILGLWVPPMYAVARGLEEGAVPKRSAVTALVFYAVNMIFRLLNFIGNVLLMFRYDITKHYVPQQSPMRKLLNMLMAGLIYWTDPHFIVQRYPPESDESDASDESFEYI